MRTGRGTTSRSCSASRNAPGTSRSHVGHQVRLAIPSVKCLRVYTEQKRPGRGRLGLQGGRARECSSATAELRRPAHLGANVLVPGQVRPAHCTTVHTGGANSFSNGPAHWLGLGQVRRRDASYVPSSQIPAPPSCASQSPCRAASSVELHEASRGGCPSSLYRNLCLLGGPAPSTRCRCCNASLGWRPRLRPTSRL